MVSLASVRSLSTLWTEVHLHRQSFESQQARASQCSTSANMTSWSTLLGCIIWHLLSRGTDLETCASGFRSQTKKSVEHLEDGISSICPEPHVLLNGGTLTQTELRVPTVTISLACQIKKDSPAWIKRNTKDNYPVPVAERFVFTLDASLSHWWKRLINIFVQDAHFIFLSCSPVTYLSRLLYG